MVKNKNVESYWTNKFSGETIKSVFPYDHSRTDVGRDFTGQYKFKLDGDILIHLLRLSNQSLLRLQMVLMGGVIALLSRYSGNNDIIIGTPIYKQGIEAQFINTVLPLRNRLTDQMSFKELLIQVRDVLSEADENQNYPIEKLLQKIKLVYSRDDDFPLFDVVVLLENIQDKSYLRDINVNMLFSFSQSDECVEGSIEYNTQVYKPETIERIVSHLKRLLRGMFADIDFSFSMIDILEEEEKKKLVVSFNNTSTHYPKEKTIITLFEQQAAQTPDNIAVEYKQQLMTYKELNRQSAKLAAHLRKLGVTTGTIVGIMSERSYLLLVGILAILKAGAAYLPLDSETPIGRFRFIIKDSCMQVLLTQEHLVEKNSDFLETFASKNILFLEQIDSQLDSLSEFSPHESAQEPSLLSTHCTPDDIAYIIYTSGTTGKPKGVIINHMGLVNYICWAAKHYIPRDARSDSSLIGNFPLFTSISFDLTVTSIFTPLITGNTVVVYEEGIEGFLTERIVDDQKVDVVKITPSHLRLIREKKMTTPRIKRFIVGGEELDTQLARDITDNFGGQVEIINEYGPTEAIVGCMKHSFNYSRDHQRTVPLGLPGDNVRIYLLDKNLLPVPVGVVGQIYISGDGIARGYLNNVQLTAEKFINDVFYPGQRMYKTGDLARWTSEGVIQFLGRTDHQLKIRGYRIELQEIEYQLAGHEQIKECVMVARNLNQDQPNTQGNSVDNNNTDPSEQSLCAYIVSDYDFTTAELRDYLSRNLPDYMIPSHFVRMDEIPVTANGKTDKRALPLPDGSVGSGVEYVAPSTEAEKELARMWQEILQVNNPGINDDFFNLGGDSMKLIKLFSSINQSYPDRVSVQDLFDYKTIKELARLLEKDGLTDLSPDDISQDNVLQDIKVNKIEF